MLVLELDLELVLELELELVLVMVLELVLELVMVLELVSDLVLELDWNMLSKLGMKYNNFPYFLPFVKFVFPE